MATRRSRAGPASCSRKAPTLERVGDPNDIATEARERFGIEPAQPAWTDTVAVVLLPIGGLVVPVIGWFIAVILLWISRVWSRRDKIIGTLFVPGGLLLPSALFFATSRTCPKVSELTGDGGVTTCREGGAIEVIALIFLILAPIMTAIYLGRKLSRARSRH